MVSPSKQCDVRRNKEKIRAYADQVHSEQGVSDPNYSRKKLTTRHFVKLEQAVLKWYRQQEAVGVAVRGSEIKDAAYRLAVQMKIPDFQASDRWLYRFRQRHGMFQKRVHRESGSAKEDAVSPLREELNKIINDEGLLLGQVYNFDETAVFWRALPATTQVIGKMNKAKGCKLDKARISELVGANADGSHRFPPVVCGKSARPRCLKDCLCNLPIPYHSSGKEWFNALNFEETFFKHIVSAILQHQRDVPKIAEDCICVLILLDNAPVHPARVG